MNIDIESVVHPVEVDALSTCRSSMPIHVLQAPSKEESMATTNTIEPEPRGQLSDTNENWSQKGW